MANERILVVDDEKGVVRFCVRILQRHGFTVSGRTDSRSVPELLKQETFDLLLTDIRMPKIDGLELLQIAKQIDPHLTVVLITGYGTMEDAIKAIRFGAQGFLMKPFEPENLVATVQDSLARRALLRDSLRLQTLLPLLEINHILQVSGGETSLARRVLEIAQRETGAARLAWLRRQPSTVPSLSRDNQRRTPPAQADRVRFIEMAVVPQYEQQTSRLPPEAIDAVLARTQPIWVSADGTLMDDIEGQPNIVGALLPMIIKGDVAGILMAETGVSGRASPFDQISLDLLSVLAGQLAIIVENVQLFQETETLYAFNEDIIQNMSNGLIAIDKEGHVTAFNPAAAGMLGSQIDEVLHQPLQKAMNGAEELIEIFQKTLTTGQACTHLEINVHHWDGRRLPISVSAAPLVTGEGDRQQPVGVVGVLEDLSERKALEAERRRLDRLAALGEMSAVVAHEIRNPMAGIAAGVEYLTRKTPAGSPEYEGALMIRGEVERVNRILEDILFVARPMQLNLSNENLSDIIESVVQRCQPQINESRVTVSAVHAAKLPPLKVDRQRLEQVFTNLIINATQAMSDDQSPERRELFLKTELCSVPKNPVPDYRRGAEQVVITIADTGPGIPPDIRQRIFEPFFTTKARGTGLGLTVAHRVIEEHKGTIKIEGEPGRGTRFVITLPIARRLTA